jgi:hypothetical protein
MFTKTRQIFRFKYIILNILLHILRVIIFECNNIKYPLTLKSKSYFNVSCALHLISTFVLLPLGWYLCCWIISHRRYHPLSSQFWLTWQIDILIPKCVFKKSKYWKVKQIKSFGSISNKARQNWLLSGWYLLWLIIQQQRYQPNGSNTNVDIKCSAK